MVEASAGTDSLLHMTLADLGSGYSAAGDTVAVPLSAVCVASGQAAVLGVHTLQGTAQPAAAVAAAVAVDGNHAGHSMALVELGKQQAAALFGNSVAATASDMTVVTASGVH